MHVRLDDEKGVCWMPVRDAVVAVQWSMSMILGFAMVIDY